MNVNYDNLVASEEMLKSLSEEERSLALSILSEFSNGGGSAKYTELKYKDYKEIPVDIETFLTDDRYLGIPWKDVSGKSKIYPFWMGILKQLFPNNTDTNYNTFLESGSRGIGKSEIACGAVCPYLMYRLMCLKNPLEFYSLKPTEKIVFAFMNIKLDLSEEIAVSKFQKTIQMSPWFMGRGKVTRRDNLDYWNPPEPLDIVIGSQSSDVIGKPIFFAFFDEISFIRNKDIARQKEIAKDMIDTAIGGMFTRFIIGGKNPTVLAVASSKRSEQSFMEAYIRSLSEHDGSNTLVVDKAVWEVKPNGTYSEDSFYVGVGNKYMESIVIPDSDYTEDRLSNYTFKGYKVIKVPIDFKAKFLEDMDRALCDYAGISSSTLNKYLSSGYLNDCINEDFKNPMPDIIEVGDGKDDLRQYKNFFKMDNVPKEYMNKPMYVHLDMSVSGDKTGIAGVWIIGKKVSTDEQQSKDLSFRLAFSTSIKAPKGRQISFEKNRLFIRWLREVGFNIKEVTSDTFQSYTLQQELKSDGFNCSILSVDRVDTQSLVCLPYQYFKSTVYERRFCMYRSQQLFNEAIDVERDINTGKIDHSPNGSKDVLDAVVGATFTASKHAEEYAFNYGESLEMILQANEDTEKKKLEQMTVDFERELEKLNPLTNANPTEVYDDEKRMNFENQYTQYVIL